MTKYPFWKYLLIVVVVSLGLFYALPNVYGEDPGIQLRANRGQTLSQTALSDATKVMANEKIAYKRIEARNNRLEIRFDDSETQLIARESLSQAMGKDHAVSLTLLSSAPEWMTSLGLAPLNLGLDLRGGVHFLLQVDTQDALSTAKSRAISDIKNSLRTAKLRYKSVALNGGDVRIQLRKPEQQKDARRLLSRELTELTFKDSETVGVFSATFSQDNVDEILERAVTQNMTALRNRIDQLGVAEPIVQRQGKDRIVIQLPGVQDPARAKRILGRAATLEIKLVDETSNNSAINSGKAPSGSRLYSFRDGRTILLNNDLLFSGDNIIDAKATIDSQGGGSVVSVTLDAEGDRINRRVTGKNIGNRMAVIYLETVTEAKRDSSGFPVVDDKGNIQTVTRKIEEVLTAPVIQSQLGKRFQITGMDDTTEAQDLALMLRSGALAAPVQIIEERTVGPSLGQDNINKGFKSVMYGLLMVLIFMAFYYRVFGLIADLALIVNLVLVVAVLSLFQATLTLPGIAGIVLTVGMAVDANVLIFERIREELRQGVKPWTSIERGYDQAFSTIMDANITTLIAAVVLYSFGTGSIKGFAVTLAIGIITSMFTAIILSKGAVHLIYGKKRKLESIAI